MGRGVRRRCSRRQHGDDAHRQGADVLRHRTRPRTRSVSGIPPRELSRWCRTRTTTCFAPARLSCLTDASSSLAGTTARAWGRRTRISSIPSRCPGRRFRTWPTVAGIRPSTALPDGRMLVASGGQACLSCLADVPEIFDPTTGQFSQLTSARLAIWYYPFMFVLPDGRILSAGSNEQAVRDANARCQHRDLVDGGCRRQGRPQRRDVSAGQDPQDRHGH